MKSKELKSKKGITLIALVVTIVVLLILAGTTINMLFSDQGIIKKAQEAGNKMNEAIEKDKQAINNLGEQLNSLLNKETSEDTGDSGNSGGQGETQIISFTIDGTTYSALSGMSWEDWINSSYNSGGFRVNSEDLPAVVDESGRGVFYKNGPDVQVNDIRSAVQSYGSVTGGHSYFLGNADPLPIIP